MFHEPGSTAFDLYATASFLLDMLDILSTMTNDSRTQVKSRDGFQIDRNSFLRPFALLLNVNMTLYGIRGVQNSPSHIRHVRPVLVALFF